MKCRFKIEFNLDRDMLLPGENVQVVPDKLEYLVHFLWVNK